MSSKAEVLYKTEFKRWAVENHMRASDIAKAVGISTKSVYAYLQGWRLPSRNTMRKMEEALGINTRDIFGI